MLFIIFKVQMISTQQVVQFHCLQIIRIYKQTINRSHGFYGRSPIFFLQCMATNLIDLLFFMIAHIFQLQKRSVYGEIDYFFKLLICFGPNRQIL